MGLRDSQQLRALILQRTQLQFPAHTPQLRAAYSSSSKDSEALFWSPRAPDQSICTVVSMCTDVPIGTHTHIHIRRKKGNFFFLIKILPGVVSQVSQACKSGTVESEQRISNVRTA